MPNVPLVLRRLLARPEPHVFGAFLLVLVAGYVFVELADELGEGALADIDNRLLDLTHTHVVRSADSTVADVARNLTALGGYPVITLLLLLVVGFLLLHGAGWQAAYVVGVTVSGALLMRQLKTFFLRARPTLVEPLTEVDGFSFPSGHAMSSAVVYLTLGILLASSVQHRRSKLYVLSVALLLPGIVGVSRVLLGVHYPSDVLAGWTAGLAWALSCWLAFELLVQRRSTRPATGPPTGDR